MNYNKVLFGLLISGITFSGCDKITNPIKVVETNGTLPNTPPTYIDSSTNYKTYKLLLEDCTGHLCGNCPRAALIGDSLIDEGALKYNIIMMQDNLGFDAPPPGVDGAPELPAGHSPSAFLVDYRCQASDDWQTLFNFQIFPNGMINRRDYTSTSPGNVAQNYTTWLDSIRALLIPLPSPMVEINIHDSCWVPQRIIGMSIQINVVTPLQGAYMMEQVIVEDSIQDWQLDFLLPEINEYDSVYMKRNTLRGAINFNSWGDPIPTSVTSGATSYTRYYTYNFKTGENGKAAGWNMAHCYIVAFVYNQATYQVVQAEMIKVE
jgi:hypothetical protein